MADNTVIPAGAGGDSIRDIDKGGNKTQVVTLDLGGAGAESLIAGSMPVTGSFFQATQPVSGTFFQATQPVSGTFWQATQPVSLFSQPLPTGASTETTLASVLSALGGNLAVSAVRRDADTTTGTDGVAQTLYVNDAGRLKVSVTPADIAQTTGSITANAQTVFVQVRRFSNLSIQMVATSLVGHNISFEASNNSTTGSDGNWVAVQVVRSNANTVETVSGVIAATPVYMWQVNVSDYNWFRVRATAHTSGTAAYTFNPSAYVSEPVPAVQVTGTQAVSGTVTATVTGGTTLPVTPTQTFTNSAATTNATSTKASAGTLWSVTASNINAAVRYLKLYNKASAPTVGTDVPVMTLPIPIGGFVQWDGGSNGIRFGTGIAWALTASAADSDTTAVSASEHKVAIAYT